MIFSLIAAMTLADIEPKRVAFSFDDTPRHAGAFFTPEERTQRLIAAMDEAGVEQAVFFVNPGRIENAPDGEARIDAFVAAGHVIANHSWSHQWLHRTDTTDYIADIDKAADWLRGREGYRPWYRYPFLDHGRRDLEKRDAVRAALAERELRVGYVTIDNYDWSLDSLANAAKREGRSIDMAALCDLYAETLVMTSEHFDTIAQEQMGRSPAHMLLLHETDIAANCLGTLVDQYREAGWEIVTADEAYADPLFDFEPDTWFLGSGRVAAIAHVNGASPRILVHERTDEKVLERLFEERVIRHDD
ncbi:polysaccharide deacetylase family protein [Sphingomicrobium sediminis]|uniref:Chitooligosaccharide deacetylase n=1 Tax=Sphingomicrobium sediminis TaxID=2950949 RepID=A0A9X2EJB7_9SPHN|nr:polysaccharide deacetylase family protein [Sphingomicrobium sediminis]MCM8556322.1 polysaccharide deacetylase family protein [Sphingomicrobium sediminis]